MLEDFLPLVTKPARYIDHEINSVHKDPAKVRTRVCLFFPDAYEVGMSHLGLRILYAVLNEREDTFCERVYSPWPDYEARLRKAGRRLASLETNTPLADFAILGVTLQYELSYSNVLTGLDLGGIPLRSRDRGDRHPLVVAGGPCALNPEPLSSFIDVFFIGEAEEAIHEIVELRQRHSSRDACLAALAERDGFYVPALGKKSVRRRFLKNLDAAPWPARPLVPLLKPVHDRVSMEVARGCIRGCRFCQAGVIYRPYRERSPERVKDLLAESLRCTGYDELSLASLSTGDYAAIGPLMQDLVRTYAGGRISISLPSLRVGTLTPEMVAAVAGVRKTGFTLAPEAGSERLRRVINKPVSDQDLLDAAETVFRSGWKSLKLYCMVGLPTETDADLDGIARMAHELAAVGKRLSRRPVQIAITVSTFVPKPHTPFQWFGQATPAEVSHKQEYLNRTVRRKGVMLKPHSGRTSLLEGAFARGDAAMAGVLEEAVRLGCRFDGWTEQFNAGLWEQAFRSQGLDPEAYACRSFGLDDPLPWDYVQSGVTKRFLAREYERALAAETTENCRVQCERCGIGCTDGGTPAFGSPPGTQAAPPAHSTVFSAAPMPRRRGLRIRIRYTKKDRLRFLSHLDLMTLFQRAATRAGVPLAFSEGFNPHPKLSFGPALPVGMESEAEYLDLETEQPADLLATVKGLNAALPAGIRVLGARPLPPGAASLAAAVTRFIHRVRVPEDRAGDLEGLVEGFLAQASVVVEREGKTADIRPAIEAIRIVQEGAGREIEIVTQERAGVRARMQDVVERLFGINREEALLFQVRRIAAFQNSRGSWIDPLSAD